MYIYAIFYICNKYAEQIMCRTYSENMLKEHAEIFNVYAFNMPSI